MTPTTTTRHAPDTAGIDFPHDLPSDNGGQTRPAASNQEEPAPEDDGVEENHHRTQTGDTAPRRKVTFHPSNPTARTEGAVPGIQDRNTGGSSHLATSSADVEGESAPEVPGPDPDSEREGKPVEDGPPAEPRTLRYYQREAHEEVIRLWEDGYERCAVILPTGTGKSTVIGACAAEMARRGYKVLMLAHRDQLLGQMKRDTIAVDPSLYGNIGIVVAARNEVDYPVVAASFQTLARSPKRLTEIIGDDPDQKVCVLVDECHHATADTYMSVLSRTGLHVRDPLQGKSAKAIERQAQRDEDADAEDDLTRAGKRAKSSRATADDFVWKEDSLPRVVACGFTATMSRADGARLGELWPTIAYERDITWAMAEGFLVEPHGKTVKLPELDKLGSIRTVAGDYNAKQLDEVMRASVDSTIDAVMRHASERAMIVFAASVEHAEAMSEGLNGAGIAADYVVGSHSKQEREAIYERYHSGELQALVTVMVLTEGADFPRCDCVVMARPTRSQVLLTQMLGRALRLYTDPVTGEEKKSALVLDLTGVARDTKLVTLTDLWGGAEVREYDENGEEILPEPEVDPDLPPALPGLDVATKERTGDIELEDHKFVANPFDNVLALTTREGYVYVPAGNGANGLMLWPPAPHLHDRVYVIQLSPRKNPEPWVDQSGVPIAGTYEQALNAARRVAFRRKNPKGYRAAILTTDNWRAAGNPPSDKQRDMANKLGIRVNPQWSKGDISDAITCDMVAKRMRTVRPIIESFGLESARLGQEEIAENAAAAAEAEAHRAEIRRRVEYNDANPPF